MSLFDYFDHCPVNLDSMGGYLGVREMLDNSLSSFPRQGIAQCLITHQRLNMRSQGVFISFREYQRGVTRNIRDRSAAGANHGNARSHRLDDHPPELLLPVRERA